MATACDSYIQFQSRQCESERLNHSPTKACRPTHGEWRKFHAKFGIGIMSILKAPVAIRAQVNLKNSNQVVVAFQACDGLIQRYQSIT
jgi:hypothetical protein